MNMIRIGICILLTCLCAGCTFVIQSGRRSDVQKIQTLSSQLDELNRAKGVLEVRLAQEIKDKQVKLQVLEKGLVITFVADVLFDSGKAKIRTEAYALLDKVASVLNETVPDLNVGIEGHTDNEPIKYSGWKSNWELSSQRAMSVLHYLVDTMRVSPSRVTASGHGEFKPVASNTTLKGRQLNRRVEVVILPRISKVKAQEGLQ